MRVAQLDFADPSFPVSLVERAAPALPGPDWARVAVTYGGICGSDLHLLREHEAGTSLIFLPYVGFPMEIGHEIAGVVVEAGPSCPVPVGTRVAVDPVLACAARGFEPCHRCAAGEASACLRISEGPISGMGLGFAQGLGGGWSDEVLAHLSQLHPVPHGLEDDRAVALAEPLSIAVHGLLRREPPDGAPLLVVGAGIIGLAAVVAARALCPSSEITVVARHPHQAEAARALGAGRVVGDGPWPELLAELGEACGSRVMGMDDGLMLAEGFPVTVEAVGTPSSIDLALRSTAQRGQVHLFGAAARVAVDLAPLWFKELDLVGTFCHAVDRHRGVPAHSFARALELLAAGAMPAEVVVTHTYPLSELRQAVETALARDAGAIKVLLSPGSG